MKQLPLLWSALVLFAGSVRVETYAFDQARSAEFFNVARYPTAVFQSTAVHRAGNAEVQVTGSLALHGVTRPVTLSARALDAPADTTSSRVTRWQATAELKRAEFGLVWSPLIEASQAVGGVISLQISVEAFRR